MQDVYLPENANDEPLYGADIREAYGDENYTRVTKIMRALNSIVQLDRRIVQMALVVFLFSNSLATLTDTMELPIKNRQHVFQTQNTYTEQLWTLLEKSYGRAQAARLFSTLISKCLLTQGLLRDLQHDVFEKLNPCQVPPFLRSIMQSA